MPLISKKEWSRVFSKSITFELHESYAEKNVPKSKSKVFSKNNIYSLKTYLMNSIIEIYIEQLNIKNMNLFQFKKPYKIGKQSFNDLIELKNYFLETFQEITDSTLIITDEELEEVLSTLYTYEEKYDLLSISKFLNNIKKDTKSHYRGAKNVFTYISLGVGIVSIKNIKNETLFEGLLWNDLIFDAKGNMSFLNDYLHIIKEGYADMFDYNAKQVLTELNPNEYFLTTLGFIQNAFGDIKPLCNNGKVIKIKHDKSFFQSIKQCYTDLMKKELYFPTGENIKLKNDFSNYFDGDYTPVELEVQHFNNPSKKKLKTIDNTEIISFNYTGEEEIFFEANILNDILERYTIPDIEQLTGFKKDEILNIFKPHFFKYDKEINNGDCLGYIELSKAKNFSKLELIKCIEKAINYSIIANKKVTEFKNMIKEFNEISGSNFKYLSPTLLNKDCEGIKRTSKVPKNKSSFIADGVEYVELKYNTLNILTTDEFSDIIEFYYINQKEYNLVFNYYNLMNNKYSLTEFNQDDKSDNNNIISYYYQNLIDVNKEKAKFGLNAEKEKVSLVDNQLLG